MLYTLFLILNISNFVLWGFLLYKFYQDYTKVHFMLKNVEKFLNQKGENQKFFLISADKVDFDSLNSTIYPKKEYSNITLQ